MAPSSFEQQCFQDETVKVCRRLGGTQIANRFCVLDGTDWTFIGPTVYEKTETIGQTNDFCRELKQSTTNFFNFMDSYEIAGRFCLVNERIPTTTPFCTDSGCNITMGKKFCERFNGKTLAGGFMCSLCDSFRQVVGPLSWNGTLLEGNPKYCEGAFCAIPRRGTQRRMPTQLVETVRTRSISSLLELLGFFLYPMDRTMTILQQKIRQRMHDVQMQSL